MADQIFSVEFDASAFVEGVDEAVTAAQDLEGATDGLTQSLTDVAKSASKVSFNKPVTEMNALTQSMRQFKDETGKLDLSKVNKALDEFATNIPALEQLLAELKAQLATMSESDEGFRELSAAVKKVETGLKQLKGGADNAGAAFVPLRTKLKNVKLEMQQLEAAGQENTERYRELQIEAAELTDKMGDQAEAIRSLASDTFALDATVGTFKQVANGFQLVAGAQALLGGESEETQKVMQRLLGIMAIVNGLQELQAFLTGNSAAKLALQTVWTNALAVSQRILAISTATASTAMRGLAAALAATGIGAIVVAIGLLINALIEWADDSEEAERANVQLGLSIERLNEQLEDNIAFFERRRNVALAQAKAEGKSEEELYQLKRQLAEEELTLLKADYNEKLRLSLESMNNENITTEKKKEINDEYLKAEKRWLDASSQLSVDYWEEQGRLNQKGIDLAEAYAKKLLELTNKAKTEREKLGGVSDAEITARYAREFSIEEAEIQKQFKDLGEVKVNALLAQARAISNLQRDAEIGENKKARDDAKNAILNDLKKQQSELTAARIELITDSYTQSQAAIQQTQSDNIANVQQNLADFKTKINEALSKGLISGEFAAAQIATAEEVALDAQRAVIEKAQQDVLELNRNFFEQRLADLDTFAKRSEDKTAQAAAAEILVQAEALSRGEITYEQYEKNITALQEKYAKLRLEETIKNNENQIAAIQQQLGVESDAEIKAKLEDQIVTLKTGIDQAKTEILTYGKSAVKDARAGLSGIDTIVADLFGIDPEKGGEEIKAIEKLVTTTYQSIASYAKAASEAEIASIDRAIEKQKEKLDTARALAKEGNVEALRIEEERLDRLQKKREAAARRQLKIDAAIQSSQILVAVAGAAAQIAKGGTVNVLTGLASIIAAIGAGASLVRQLQASQPNGFYRGTDYVSRGNNPVGRDTIPARLHEGEAVISADTNRRYAPAIQAIRRGLLPENVMNSFVRDYTGGVRYDNVRAALDNKKTAANQNFDEMNNRLARLESVMSSTADVLKSLDVNVRMDRDGFSAAISTYMNRRNKALKS